MNTSPIVKPSSNEIVERKAPPLVVPRHADSPRGIKSLLLFVAMAAVYLLPFMRLLLPWSNEGTLASGAVRIAHGQVFARDFFEVMGPGTFYLLAAFFKLLGTSFLTMRIDLFLTSLGTATAMNFLARQLLSRFAIVPCMLLCGIYYGLQWPGISHHVDSNFFALSTVVALAVWQQKRWRALVFASGVLAGITTCVHQPKGFFLLVAVLLWFLFERRRDKFSPSLFLTLIAGYLTVAAVVLGYFWANHALKDVYYANVVWPSHNYEAVNRVPYALGLFHEYWQHWIVADAKWSVGLASILIVPFLYVVALPVTTALLVVIRRKDLANPSAALYLFCGAALWLSETHRKDIYHLVFASPLLIIVSIYLLSEVRKRWSDYALQILAVTATCLAVFNLLAVTTAHAVPTRVGTVAMYRSNGALAYLNAHTQPGEEIFAYPYCPMYYFLSATMDPTRFLTLTYNYNTTEEFESAIRTIDEHRVRYVVWDSNFLTKTAPIVFTAAATHPPAGFLMEDYLNAHYSIAQDFDGLRIMERKPDSAAAASTK